VLKIPSEDVFVHIWGVPYMEDLQNGGFILEKSIKMNGFGKPSFRIW
jgi:hypothetical protein